MKLTKEQLKQSGWALGILLLAAVLLQTVSGIQYVFTRNGIREEARKMAEIRLENANLLVESGMNSIEVAVDNISGYVEASLRKPESLYQIAVAFLGNNQSVTECGILFKPGYVKGQSENFQPSAIRQADGTVIIYDHSRDNFNFYERDWYKGALEKDGGHWTNPYNGVTTGDLISTYSVPLKDASGETVGVLFADVSTKWLKMLVEQGASAYENAFSVILNHSGETVVDNRGGDVPEDLGELRANMVAQEKGELKVTYKDTVAYAFYAPIGRYGWSMAIICPEQDMFSGFRRMSNLLVVLMLLGLALLVFIMYRSAHSVLKLQEVENKKHRMENELNIAHGIQMGMIPKIFPPYPDRDDIDVFASLTAAKEVGGDLYDFFISDEKLWFCIGDVSGKGVPASLVMAVTRSQFRTVAMQGGTPEHVMRTINDGMADMNESNMFVTMIIARLDLATGELLFCNAGHNPPMIIHGREKRYVQMVPNMPVGLLPGFLYKGESSHMKPGDAVFLYTDGLTEAENPRKELFGEDAALAALREDVSTREMINIMTEAVTAHIAGAPQSDDLTMLAIRYKGGQQYTLSFPNDVSELAALPAFVDGLGLDPADANALNLALEEAATNVVMYAYGAPRTGMVDIEVLVLEDKVKTVLSDSGRAFDPTSAPDPDITAPGEERPVGGLGIFLVRKLMDEVRYERRDGRNILTMIKKRK